MTRHQLAARRFLAALLLAAGVLAFGAAPRAAAVTSVSSYLVAAQVDAAGAIHVQATITPDGAPGDLVQRFASTLDTNDGHRYRFTIADVSATTADGADAGAVSTPDGGYTVVTVPDVTVPVTLNYTVTGAAIRTEHTTTVSWRFLQGLNVPVETFEATVEGPGPFTMIDCAAGAPSSPGSCTWFTGGTHDQQVPTFHDGPRGAGEVVQVIVRYPEAVVASNAQIENVWSLDRAFSVRPLPLASALMVGLLGLAALWLTHRRFGQDARGEGETPTVVAQFRPVAAGQSEFVVTDGIRPGQVGTLADERVDPVDVAATVVDLAVHGSLLIRELPRTSPFARTDWEFVRRGDPRNLRPYESTLVDVLTPGGSPGRLSVVGHDVTGALPKLQSELYDDVVERGWFARRPDATRNIWTLGSRIALAVSVLLAVLLVIFSSFGLLGLVLIALSLGAGIIGQEMPARTAKGSSVLAGLGVLSGQLLTAPTGEMPHGREHHELSEVLPYAMVLGGTERWIDGLVATDGDEGTDETELDWYHGPAGWHLQHLPDSLRNFVTTLEGSLVER